MRMKKKLTNIDNKILFNEKKKPATLGSFIIIVKLYHKFTYVSKKFLTMGQ